MKLLLNTCLFAVLMMHVFTNSVSAQAGAPADRLRELREKARARTITAEEKKELDEAMAARQSNRAARTEQNTTTPPGSPSNASPRPTRSAPPKTTDESAPAGEEVEGETNAPAAPGTSKDRAAQAAERLTLTIDHMRVLGKAAFAAADSRSAPSGSPQEVYVNNEAGDDGGPGTRDHPFKTLAKGVAALQPGDHLHLDNTNTPYHETLRIPDGFGGSPERPTVIDGHGATLTGCDPLRLDGWVPAGTPGLFKSTRFLAELEEFTDSAKTDRVYFLFDGVPQHMGRSSKGKKARFPDPSSLRPGEWTYTPADKTFYLKVTGKLEDAKIEAPYRRNGVAVRAPKVAATNFTIRNLVVCHVLNDGFNIHGATRNLRLENIAAYECGDDGISPHDMCEITIDGYWAIGNSTGMANGNLAITHANNLRLEGNLGAQYMSAHAPVTELHNAVLIAPAGTDAVHITNSKDSTLELDNARITTPAGQKIMLAPNSALTARRLTVTGPDWETRGSVKLTNSRIAGGRVSVLEGGRWEGRGNVYTSGATAPPGETPLEKPDAGAGANDSEIKLPPRPVPNPRAGKFPSLAAATAP